MVILKKVKIFIFISLLSFSINNVFGNSGETIQKNINIEQFNEYKEFVKEENKSFRENLDSTFNKHLELTKEIKENFWLYFKIIIGILSVLGIGMWFYIQKITKNTIKETIREKIEPQLENEKTNITLGLNKFYEEQKLGLKIKNILYVKLGELNDKEFLEKQDFKNITLTENINNDSLELCNIVVIDVRGISITNGTNEIIEKQIKTINNYNFNIPVVLYIEGRYDGIKTDFFTFANNKITLVNQILDCLNINLIEKTQFRS